MEKTGYRWWMDRLRTNFELYDIVRIDHFRGFEAYWEIPFGSPTARKGKWVKGPGLSFFEKIAEEFPQARIIAEDLGSLSPEVTELLRQTGLPGMTVLQFAFGGDSYIRFLPHNLTLICVVFPGTHDNDTTRGWYESADPELQDHLRRYLRISGEEISWDFIRTAYRSPSRLAIITLQDLLDLDSSGRFNVPGNPEGNWQWRYVPGQLAQLRAESANYLAEMAELYGRDPEWDPPSSPMTEENING
jgi:4-alpha-glucanotransferase